MKAITPQEAAKSKASTIPDAVFKAFNQLIVANLDRGSATFRQDDVMKVLVSQGFKRDEVFENSWLDVESTYRKVGWKVEYDKPGYNEDYPATFTFKAKSNAATYL